MENEGIQPLVLRITMRAYNLRRAEMCSGSRKSSSKPASDRRLMNPEAMKVASMMARIRNRRLLAEPKAPRATTTQAMVNNRPRRVTCWRVPRSSEEWMRDQMRSTSFRIRGIQEGAAVHSRNRGRELRPIVFFPDFGDV